MQYVSNGNIVDIGCGKGSQLKKLPTSFVPYGIEISKAEAEYAIEYVERRGGRVVVKSAIDGLKEFPDQYATGVLMRSYLEHETDPKAVLQETCRILRPGGVAVIKVPKLRLSQSSVPGRQVVGFPFSRPFELFHATDTANNV